MTTDDRQWSVDLNPPPPPPKKGIPIRMSVAIMFSVVTFPLFVIGYKTSLVAVSLLSILTFIAALVTLAGFLPMIVRLWMRATIFFAVAAFGLWGVLYEMSREPVYVYGSRIGGTSMGDLSFPVIVFAIGVFGEIFAIPKLIRLTRQREQARENTL